MGFRVENRCSNCGKNDCKDRGEVVEWMHCRRFEVSPVLIAQEKLRREAKKVQREAERAKREAERADSSCS